jgi:phage shock protein PspC (stress-responsive transcriptional regulator)
MIGGVAGGVAEYFGVDPVLVRFAFIALTLINGIGLILYIVAMVVIPEEPFRIEVKSDDSSDFTVDETEPFDFRKLRVEKKGKFSFYFGVLLILAGILFGLDNFIPFFDFTDAIPVLLVVLGIWIIFSGRNKKIGVKNEA